ncbi:glucan biosynthesis protein [Rubellimicrobium roseum]|uniref:Glucan biosynthesis protein n=1 Tax=Rubellimicrobium roseum TaxID=687525 RepID=A0A5C4N904_9RHOB|nr:glucan biosynthesis protein [Rubellimicrobium roseum]TNC66826.1 glucan biosynthesis protein [Rubellimicrobium roseum]
MPSNALTTPTRRDLLKLAALAALLPHLAGRAEAQAAQPFSFDGLTEEMRALAGQPYVPADTPEGWWSPLDYDGYRLIRFRDDLARWSEGPDAWRLHAFHMGWLFPEPVRLFDVSDGTAHEIAFSTDDFQYFGELTDQVPEHGDLPGVAGFKLNWPLNDADRWDEVVSFVGASYFRALGQGNVYGASARGLALNTWTMTPEEFPRFSRFYLSREGEVATVHATLEGPSLAGAYRFVIRPGAVTEIDVTARLFFRSAVEELGVAPLTSMFLFAGQNRGEFDDYRPNVHDSDGLGIAKADGDRVWRPLNNPERLASSYFAETSPRSFGLYQRMRDFESYQDPGARYDLRPSIEVVPQGDWGAGAVRLVEIPSDLEANDNIVAMWVPEAKVAPGDAREFAYTLRWGDLTPDPDGPLAVVAETRAGAGGVSGVEALENARKFAVDFRGGTLASLEAGAPVEPVVTLSGGHVLSQVLERLPEGSDWRVVLDVAAPKDSVVEITLHLASPDARLSETWAYQWVNV